MHIETDRETTAGWNPAVYNELRRLARSHLRREREGHTLNATGLVHEAWLRLAPQRHNRFASRSHFFGAPCAACWSITPAPASPASGTASA
jgi:hypothetical protein